VKIFAVVMIMKPWKAKADESPLAVHKEAAIADVDVEARNFRRVDPLPASDCKRPGGPWDRTDWTCIRHPKTDKPIQAYCSGGQCYVQCSPNSNAMCRLQEYVRAYFPRRVTEWRPASCGRRSSVCRNSELRPDKFRVIGWYNNRG